MIVLGRIVHNLDEEIRKQEAVVATAQPKELPREQQYLEALKTIKAGRVGVSR